MSALPLSYIMWNPALMERLLIAIITTGAHLSPKKWKEAASSFYSCSQQFIDIFHANEEKAIRRLKEKFAEEQKKICQTMGWRDYNQGNLSAFDGDLGPVEVKMRQIIQEQDEKKDEKEKVKARQKRLGEIGAVSLDVRTEGSLKPKNKRSNPLKNIISGSSKSSVPDSQEEDEVHIYILFFIFYFHMRMFRKFLKRKRLL
jgi:hypothetical protein